MNVNAAELKMGVMAVAAENLACGLKVHAKFTFCFSGGDMIVRLGIHCRIHAQGNLGYFFEPLRHMVDRIQLRSGFHIKEKNAVAQCVFDFLLGLGYLRRNDFFRRASHPLGAEKLTA